MRRGISFTLTVVVVGMILILTALSIITLGGSQISQYFNVVGSEQSAAAACHDVEMAAHNYCSGYTAHKVRVNHTDSNGNGEYDTGDRYYVVDEENRCGETSGSRKPGDSLSQVYFREMGVSDGTSISNPPSDVTGWTTNGYLQTASDSRCDWTQHSPVDETVVVNGDEINCVESGYVRSTTCPVR
ncbi:MAG: hypothetical protein ABEJ83_00505 [Candidatus Nanohaloarchaea archaeon]